MKTLAWVEMEFLAAKNRVIVLPRKGIRPLSALMLLKTERSQLPTSLQDRLIGQRLLALEKEGSSMSGVGGGKSGVGHAAGSGRGGENPSGLGSREEIKPKSKSAKQREKFKRKVAASDPAAVAKNIELKRKSVARKKANMTAEQKSERSRKRRTTYAKRVEILGEDGAKLHKLRRRIRNLDNRLQNYARQAHDVTDRDALVALNAKEDETKILKSELEQQAELLELKLK